MFTRLLRRIRRLLRPQLDTGLPTAIELTQFVNRVKADLPSTVSSTSVNVSCNVWWHDYPTIPEAEGCYSLEYRLFVLAYSKSFEAPTLSLLYDKWTIYLEELNCVHQCP